MARIGLFFLFVLISVLLCQSVLASPLLPPTWHQTDLKQASDVTGTNSAPTVEKPANLAEGDLIIIILNTFNNLNVAGVTPPSGFTQIRLEADAVNFQRPSIVAYYKIAGPNEPANYVFQLGQPMSWRILSGRVTEFDPNNPIDKNSGANSAGNAVTSINIPGITPFDSNSLLIAARGLPQTSGGGDSLPQGETQIALNVGSSSNHMGWQSLVDSSATGPKTFSWNTARRATGLMFNINGNSFSEPDDVTDVGRLLMNPNEKTVIIALGPSNQRGEWRIHGDWYTMYSALLETWNVPIAGMPSFTHTKAHNVQIPNWVRPLYLNSNVIHTKSQPGELPDAYSSQVIGRFPYELEERRINANFADDRILSGDSWFLPTEDDYNYNADISRFRSISHEVEHVLIWLSPSQGVSTSSNGPKIRLRWARSNATSGGDVTDVTNVVPAWHSPGDNRIHYTVSSFGNMPNDGNIWAPRIEFNAGAGDERQPNGSSATYTMRHLIRIKDGNGIIWWPMGRGNWGYKSTLADTNWLDEGAITDEGWVDGLSAIRSNATRLIIFDHIGLGDIVSGQQPIANMSDYIISFHQRLREVSASAGYTDVRIVGVVDPLVPATTEEKLRYVSQHKRIASEQDAGVSYFVDLAEVMDYQPQPSEWLADSRHSTYLGTVELMKMLWKELNMVYGTVGDIYWEADSARVLLTVHDNDTLEFLNTDTINHGIRLYGLTDALVYDSDNNAYCLDINGCDGNINATLSPSERGYVLNRFSLIENQSRVNSPLSYFFSSNNVKNISSTLSQTINSPIVFNVGNCVIDEIRYNSPSGFSRTYLPQDFTCLNNKVSLNLQNIESTTSGANGLRIVYGGNFDSPHLP